MRIKGEVKFPGDKSISHRALMLAALTDGNCVIVNCSTAEDVERTRQCLSECGINSQKNGSGISITGGTLRSPDRPLDCGNSGTTARLLTGLLAGQGVSATLTGDPSLRSRPMNRIIHPLKRMGVSIESENGHLPLRLRGKGPSKSIEYTVPVASAQVKSAILFAGLGAPEHTAVIEKTKTRDHTEIMLKSLETGIHVQGHRIRVTPLKVPPRAFKLAVPGDPSTAAFFAAAAALVPDSDLILKGVLMNPTRSGFYDALKRMGVPVSVLNRHEKHGESVGDFRITPGPLRGISIEGSEIPRIIDEIPILAVLATQADGTTTVRNAAELRIKESDRIKAICTNLSRMGANITELEDGFVIEGPTPLHGAHIATFDDHRLAMAFSIAGLIARGPVRLDNPSCVRISCPEFGDLLKKVTN